MSHTAFVTGATGFVGGHLCEALIEQGWTVRALVRPKSKRTVLEQAGAELVEGTLDDCDRWVEKAAECAVVYHLAATTRGLQRSDFFEVNAEGADRLGRALRRVLFEGKLIHLSSLAAGGPALNGVARDESMIDSPVSHYGRSKRAAEVRLDEAAQGMYSAVHLRPGAIYGPREHEIYQVLLQLKRLRLAFRPGGAMQLQLIHVRDVVRALIAAFALPASERSHRLYLVERELHSMESILSAAGRELGIKPLVIPIPLLAARVVGRAMDSAGRIAGKPLSPLGRDKVRELSARYWVADPSLAERTLAWRAYVPLAVGLPETIVWYRENRWL